MSKVREKFEEVGFVTVDAGLIQIGDPCYASEYEDHDEWMNFLNVNKILGMKESVSINHKAGGPGKAIVVGGFGGDGVYPVSIKRCKDTGMVKEVKIKFF